MIFESRTSEGIRDFFIPTFSGLKMMETNMSTCCCGKSMPESSPKYHCKSCGSFFCRNCIAELGSNAGWPARSKDTAGVGLSMKLCKLCFELHKSRGNLCDKVHPSESPRRNPEPPSPSFSGEGFGVSSPSTLTRISDCQSSNHPSPVSAHSSPCRSDEGEDSTCSFLGVPDEFFHEASDLESSTVSSRDVFYSFLSAESTHSVTVSGPHLHTGGDGQHVHFEQDQNTSSLSNGSWRPSEKIWDTENTTYSEFQQWSKKLLKPLNFETNSPIWFPPPPENVNDELPSNFFTYDDEDEVGGSGHVYLPMAEENISVPTNELDCNDPTKALILAHFRALVSQLLLSEHIESANEGSAVDWLEVITTIAWQAAKYIKPDTSRGGSMDPCDYLKVKCVASGSPGDSKLVKGIVCTKNIKHKRMISQYKNARLLILGGALEYQRVPNLLASVQTLLQQENDHLKTVVSKIEAHRPNVLLVEKTVSSCALEHLLAKEISLVLNVKRSLLERIARCTGASITPSTDHISMARLGHCELFHLEKVSEDLEPANQSTRRPLKTLMFFERCPRRLGCTIVLRGSTREELKKVKHVMQYAVFAAHHLSLETSFLADEGASLRAIDLKSSNLISEKLAGTLKPAESDSSYKGEAFVSGNDPGSGDLLLELGLEEYSSELGNSCHDYFSVPEEHGYKRELIQQCENTQAPQAADGLGLGNPVLLNDAIKEPIPIREGQICDIEVSSPIKGDDGEHSSANDNHQSILVSFSSHCLVNGTTCERTRLLRVKFYGPSDKPLGRYLRDDLFDQTYLCKSCNEPGEAHVICYTHQHANLTIKVRHLPSVKLPGEQDGKIWMWHRCLRCELVEGVPPATGRVVMSDAAWGLSFAKFLELSFYNHVAGNRVATCGHSLQRDCLRFYGFGSMVASFQYSHIDILSVYLPPPILEFSHPREQSCFKKEAYELLGKAEAMLMEVSTILEAFRDKSLFCDTSELQSRFTELNNMLVKDKHYCKDLQQLVNKDIRQLDHLRESLLMCSQSWDWRLSSLDDMIKKSSSSEAPNDADGVHIGHAYCSPGFDCQDTLSYSNDNEGSGSYSPEHMEKVSKDVGNGGNNTSLVRMPSAGSILSDHIDSAWSGVDPSSLITEDDFLDDTSLSECFSSRENTSVRRLKGTSRVYSFDSARREHEKFRKGIPPPSLYLTRPRSFHVSGDYRKMIRDSVTNYPPEAGNIDLYPSGAQHPEGARLMALQNDQDDIAAIISYALSSKEYEDRIFNRPSAGGLLRRFNSLAPDLLSPQSFGSMDSDSINQPSFSSEDISGSSHVQISFEDKSSKTPGKVKFSVTCYFAREFDALRIKCCPNEMDFIRSLSRCRKWSAQGGKSNVYFAKSLDERFVIKQVTKTELECFEEFGPDYFKYLTEALSSRSPTCLAKVLGVYQVTVKHMKGGVKKMDLMVMENLFFKRSISKVYDLKGSLRSRYISDTKGTDKVLLDMNLLETVGRNPIFVGSKGKRNLERAVWNDTSFLASVDVMDYSLLVGVDEERKELVMGIIDFMRQYTWDKQLETWVKASGILGGGGPKNASPTVISPKQYKKRFRKAMTSYFLAVPDQWTS